MNKVFTTLLASATFVLFLANAQAASSAPSSTAESTVHPAANVCGYRYGGPTDSYAVRHLAALKLTGRGYNMDCALPVKYDRYIERVVFDVNHVGVSPSVCVLSFTNGMGASTALGGSSVHMTLNTSANVDVWQYDNFGEVPAYNGGNAQNMLFITCYHNNMLPSEAVYYGSVRIDYSEQQ
jgi:hypothetical protein